MRSHCNFKNTYILIIEKLWQLKFQVTFLLFCDILQFTENNINFHGKDDKYFFKFKINYLQIFRNTSIKYMYYTNTHYYTMR